MAKNARKDVSETPASKATHWGASVPPPGRAVALVVASIFTSGALYTLAAPHLAHFLGDIGRPQTQVPWWVIIALRVIEVLGYASSGYTSSKDVLMLSIVSRTAYATILCFHFNIPPGIPALTTAIDAFSIWLPIRFLHGKHAAVHHQDIPKEASLSMVLTLIGSSFLSIFAYSSVKTFLPAFVIGHFDAVKTASPIPLPFLMFGFLPAGYCLQSIIHKRGFYAGTLSVLISSFVVGCGNIGLAIRGGDAVGVVGIVQLWNVALAVCCCILGYILQA